MNKTQAQEALEPMNKYVSDAYKANAIKRTWMFLVLAFALMRHTGLSLSSSVKLFFVAGVCGRPVKFP